MFTGRRFGIDAVHAMAVDDDLALGRILESGEHAQQRGLAAARRAEQREELALADLEVGIVDGDDGAAETLIHIADGDDRFAIIHFS